MLTKNTPTLDVHGETRDTVVYPVKQFIKDNYKMRNRYIVIIHGNGQNILKRTVHQLLKKDPLVLDYCFDGSNIGATVVTLKLDSKLEKIL